MHRDNMSLLFQPADKELGTSFFSMCPQLQGLHMKLPLEVSYYYCFSLLSCLAGEGVEILEPQWAWTGEQRTRLCFTQGWLPTSANDASKQFVLIL